MTATANPRLRLILLLGLLAAAALGAGVMLMSRAAAESEAADAPSPVLRPTAATPAKPTRAAPAPAKPKAATTKPVRPVPQPPRAPRKPAPTVAANGLPLALAAALRRDDVVVVSLVVPGGSVDELARAEAEAGAGDARAGFVALNALDRRQGGALAAKLGVLEAPAVLVYRRPETLFVQLDGFADRETVAQAAANARP